MLERILANSPVFLLIAVRCFAMVMTLPLFSIRNVSRISKVALTGYLAYLLFPHVDFSMYAPYIGTDGAISLPYIMLLIGEGLIGLLIGFYVTIIFAAFSSAGQFFAFQMGFSASEVYDALSQVENPLMGQFFNLVAMLIFLQSDWALFLFSKAIVSSFDSLNALSLVLQREQMIHFLLGSLTKLFADAFLISLPIMGTLLLISVTMGILSKAAPQMNLMSEGFPIMILVSFFIIWSIFPQICEFFIHSFSAGFSSLERLFVIIGGGS